MVWYEMRELLVFAPYEMYLKGTWMWGPGEAVFLPTFFSSQIMHMFVAIIV